MKNFSSILTSNQTTHPKVYGTVLENEESPLRSVRLMNPKINQNMGRDKSHYEDISTNAKKIVTNSIIFHAFSQNLLHN